MMDFQKLRNQSLDSARGLGYEVNPNLPLLGKFEIRHKEEIVARTLALFATVASSYGFDRASAIKWMKREQCYKYLSHLDRDFVEKGVGDPVYFRCQVEGLNAFAWALGFVERLAFDAACDDSLILSFPELKDDESSASFRSQSSLRPVDEIVAACDLSICIHWAIVDSELNSKAHERNVGRHVIIERRRALEWMLGTIDLNDQELDT